MRDPKRIKKVLEEIEKVWRKCPDFRFCQLFDNVVPVEDPFYIEDDEFLSLLKKYDEKFRKEE